VETAKEADDWARNSPAMREAGAADYRRLNYEVGVTRAGQQVAAAGVYTAATVLLTISQEAVVGKSLTVLGDTAQAFIPPQLLRRLVNNNLGTEGFAVRECRSGDVLNEIFDRQGMNLPIKPGTVEALGRLQPGTKIYRVFNNTGDVNDKVGSFWVFANGLRGGDGRRLSAEELKQKFALKHLNGVPNAIAEYTIGPNGLEAGVSVVNPLIGDTFDALQINIPKNLINADDVRVKPL